MFDEVIGLQAGLYLKLLDIDLFVGLKVAILKTQ